jgi:hypothetical protein
VRKGYYAYNAGFLGIDYTTIDYDALALDLIVALAILAAVGFLCEFVARRSERKRRTESPCLIQN